MFLFPAPPVVVPAPVIAEQTAYYDVTGTTEPQLVASLNDKGNEATHGGYWGSTQIFPSWGFDTRKVDGHCELFRPWLMTIIISTYPRWTIPPGASPALVEKWNAMLKALEHTAVPRSSENQRYATRSSTSKPDTEVRRA